MLDPYENILIGNFLYSLGLVVGSHAARGKLPACVNLLQQTPLDGPLADVHVRFPGAMRLIEFKRESNDSIKEEVKLIMLAPALADYPALEEISRTVHWYVKTAEAPLEWETKVRPYLDMLDEAEGMTMQAFIGRFVEAALATKQPECDEKLLAEYLDAVGQYAGDKSGSSSGLLVMLSDKLELGYVALDNILDMRLDLAVLSERAKTRSWELQQQREAAVDAPDQEQSIPGMGHGR